MTLEDRLRDALRDEADRRPVDVEALRVATRARLAREESRPWNPPRSSWSMVVGAAVVLLVIGAVVTLSPTGEDARHPAGGVEETFRCPLQATTRFDSGNTDDSFLPELTDDRRPAGEASGAPRHEVTVQGDEVLLRLGNADGTLASVTTFVDGEAADDPSSQRDHRYVAAEVTKCVNSQPGEPGTSDATMVTPGLPRSASDFTADDFPAGAVKVVDRLTYDVAGYAKRHTVWAHPCERTVCLTSGSRTSTQIKARLPASTPKPSDRTTQLADPDDVVGQPFGHRLIAIYDRESVLRDVSWEDREGRATEFLPVDGGWEGRLFLALAPANELQFVITRPKDGQQQASRYAGASIPS